MAEDCIKLQRKYWDEDDRYGINTIVDNGEVEEEEEEEEEALSFSDLPVGLDQKQQCKENEENCSDESESEFEFGLGFRSRPGSVSTKPLPEMCAANELFFQGRILPLRCCDSLAHSSRKNSTDQAIVSPTGSVSKSHMMDSGPISWVASTSSRSSSKGSQISSFSGMTSNSSSFGSSCGALSSVSNRFSSCTSPSPQKGFMGGSKHFVVPAGNKIRSKSQKNSPSLSSLWELFRLGLVCKPDIELHNLKIRPNNSRNGCNKIINDSNDKDASMKKKKKKKGIVRFGFLGGCNCTADSVATHLALMSTGRKKSNVGSLKEEELRWKTMELTGSDESRMTRKMEQTTEKQRHTPQSSRHRRTFEWVKDLPHSTSIHYAL